MDYRRSCYGVETGKLYKRWALPQSVATGPCLSFHKVLLRCAFAWNCRLLFVNEGLDSGRQGGGDREDSGRQGGGDREDSGRQGQDSRGQGGGDREDSGRQGGGDREDSSRSWACQSGFAISEAAIVISVIYCSPLSPLTVQADSQA